MQSTYVLQGLHLQIPNIFPNCPTNRSEALRAQGSVYKVRDTCAFSPDLGPGWGIPLERKTEAASTLPSPSGRASLEYRKCTWRSRHPAPKLSCSLYKTSGRLHSTAALKWPSLPSLHQTLRSDTLGASSSLPHLLPLWNPQILRSLPCTRTFQTSSLPSQRLLKSKTLHNNESYMADK